MYRSKTSAIFATLAGAALVTASSALAASYSGKGGMETTTYQQQSAGFTDPGLPMIARGVQEFGLNGRLNWQDDTVYTLNLSYGRFVTDNWLVGGRLSVDGVNSDAGYALGVFAEYNFLTGTKWVPFAGIGVGYNHLEGRDTSVDSVQFSGEFGIKYFMRPNMAITASMVGTWDTDRLPDGDDFGSQINFGLRYFF